MRLKKTFWAYTLTPDVTAPSRSLESGYPLCFFFSISFSLSICSSHDITRMFCNHFCCAVVVGGGARLRGLVEVGEVLRVKCVIWEKYNGYCHCLQSLSVSLV